MPTVQELTSNSAARQSDSDELLGLLRSEIIRTESIANNLYSVSNQVKSLPMNGNDETKKEKPYSPSFVDKLRDEIARMAEVNSKLEAATGNLQSVFGS